MRDFEAHTNDVDWTFWMGPLFTVTLYDVVDMMLLFAGTDHISVMARVDASNEHCKFWTFDDSGIDIVAIFDDVELYDTEFIIWTALEWISLIYCKRLNKCVCNYRTRTGI